MKTKVLIMSNKFSCNAKNFECSTCNYSTKSKCNFRNHLFIHSDERHFACSLCPYKGRQSAGLRAHMKVHSEQRPFSCKHCAYTSKRKQNLLQHLKIHSNTKPFVCAICSHNTSTKQALQKHYQSKHDNNSKKAKLKRREQMKNQDIDALNLTMKENAAEFAIKSSLPNGKYLASSASSDTKSKIFSCCECSFTCKRKCDYNKHIKRHKQSIWCCTICPFKSKLETAFKSHLSKHVEKEPLKCHHCGCITLNIEDYILHLKVHCVGSKLYLQENGFENVSIYQCPYCKYNSNKLSLLKLHISNHSEKDFENFRQLDEKHSWKLLDDTLHNKIVSNLASKTSYINQKRNAQWLHKANQPGNNCDIKLEFKGLDSIQEDNIYPLGVYESNFQHKFNDENKNILTTDFILDSSNGNDNKMITKTNVQSLSKLCLDVLNTASSNLFLDYSYINFSDKNQPNILASYLVNGFKPFNISDKSLASSDKIVNEDYYSKVDEVSSASNISFWELNKSWKATNVSIAPNINTAERNSAFLNSTQINNYSLNIYYKNFLQSSLGEGNNQMAISTLPIVNRNYLDADVNSTGGTNLYKQGIHDATLDMLENDNELDTTDLFVKTIQSAFSSSTASSINNESLCDTIDSLHCSNTSNFQSSVFCNLNLESVSPFIESSDVLCSEVVNVQTDLKYYEFDTQATDVDTNANCNILTSLTPYMPVNEAKVNQLDCTNKVQISNIIEVEPLTDDFFSKDNCNLYSEVSSNPIGEGISDTSSYKYFSYRELHHETNYADLLLPTDYFEYGNSFYKNTMDLDIDSSNNAKSFSAKTEESDNSISFHEEHKTSTELENQVFAHQPVPEANEINNINEDLNFKASNCRISSQRISDMECMETEQSCSKALLLTDIHKECKQGITENKCNSNQLSQMQYNCTNCNFTTTKKCHLMSHMPSHKRKFKCEDCNLVIHSKSEYIDHKKTHKVNFKCLRCDFKCSNEDVLNTHSLHHKKINCSVCSFKCDTSEDLATHNAVHAKVLYMCAKCNYETNSDMFLQFHMKKHKKDEEFLHCNICNYVGSSRLNLEDHMNSNHC